MLSQPTCNGHASNAVGARVASLDSLREHLQWAIELEHFTMPPYLCALYSLDASRNVEAVEVMTSVVVEEMLHLTLVANLLNAVGGRPRLDKPEMLRGYPRCPPHGDRSFDVPLLRFGPEALDVFLGIEQPAAPCAPPEGDDYETIGQFYDAVGRGLRELCAQDLLRASGAARAGFRRQPGDPCASDPRDARLEGAGPGAHADAHRGRPGYGRPDLRVRSIRCPRHARQR